MPSATACRSAASCRPFFVGDAVGDASWLCFVATEVLVHDVTMTRSAAAAAAARADTPEGYDSGTTPGTGMPEIVVA